MKINKWAALSVTAFALALVVSSGFVAYAAEDGTDEPCRPDREQMAEHRADRAENREQMKELFAAGDYEAWVEHMADKPNAEEFVTEDNFNTLVEAHALLEAGDKEGARELLDDAGIKPPHKPHKGPKPPTTE